MGIPVNQIRFGIFRFGVFEVRREERELRKHGIRIRLEDQPFEVLLALLEKPGEVVTRSELEARVWPDGTFVDFEKGLNKAVNKIRTALDDSAATPRFIETISRRGYRFLAPVTTAATEVQAKEAVDVAPSQAPPIAASSPRSKRRRWVLSILAGVAVLLGVAGALNIGLVRDRLSSSEGASGIQSLAVLPFENLTGDAGQEYLADGLTDDLISDLARIASLRVISYTSSARYKRATKGLPEIARELKVDGVVEGSLQRAGERMRINVKLVRGATDRQLWAQSYEGVAGDASLLEGRIVLAVAHQISARITAETAARMASGGTANQHAYDAYLRGRYRWNLRGTEAITEAASHFQEAVREDPKFALAWSGLADCHSIGWGAEINLALAEQYARKALELDPALSEAHVSYGFTQLSRRQFAEAERELKRGIELDPNYVMGHQFYAIYLLTMGRLQQALAENDRALELDPFSLPVNNCRGYVLIGMRQYERALKHLRAAADIEPRSSSPVLQIARIHWIRHRGADALAAELRAASASIEGHSEIVPSGPAEVEAAFARSGFRAACLRSAELQELAYPRGTPINIPLLYGCLQNADKVLEWSDRLLAKYDYNILFVLKTAPEFDFMRSDPRFQALLRRAGL